MNTNPHASIDAHPVAPSPQQISDYLHSLDVIRRAVTEREARLATPSPCAPTPLEALMVAEAALADIGGADVATGVSVGWCESRAAEALPCVRAALAAQAVPPAVPPAALPAYKKALRKIADQHPKVESSVHGPRKRCQHCGYAWLQSEFESHSVDCAYVIAHMALSAPLNTSTTAAACGSQIIESDPQAGLSRTGEPQTTAAAPTDFRTFYERFVNETGFPPSNRESYECGLASAQAVPPVAPTEVLDTDSFGRLLPVDAVPVTVLMPRRDASVILYIADAGVAIHGKPVVGWNSGTQTNPVWWTGVPGNYLDLADGRWAVTHWAPLPGDHDARAAIDHARAALKGKAS